MLLVQLLKSLETPNFFAILLYSYLNLESTKTIDPLLNNTNTLYSYLNLESTKTDNACKVRCHHVVQLLKS